MTSSQKLNTGKRVAFTATGITLLLSLMKLIVGRVFKSDMLTADAVHSAADSIAIFASGLGLWLAGAKKSKKFPYGLYKVETLISFIVGLLIIFGGIELVGEGHKKIFHVAFIRQFPLFPIIASAISIIVTYFIAGKEKSTGTLINSGSLLANARESFLDIIISTVVLAGLVLNYAGIPYVEGSVIIVISLFVLKLGMETVWTSLLVLIDANPDQDLQAELEKKIKIINGVKGIGDIKIRQSGPFKMVNCVLLTGPLVALHKAHVLADKVEDFIMSNYKHIDSVFIHLEPCREKMISAVIPVNELNGMDSKVSSLFGRAPYFMVVRFNKDNSYLEKVLDNPFPKERRFAGIKIVKQLIKNKVDILFTSGIGEIPFYMLRENYIDVFEIRDGFTVREAIDKYLAVQLKEIKNPTHTVEDTRKGHQRDH